MKTIFSYKRTPKGPQMWKVRMQLGDSTTNDCFTLEIHCIRYLFSTLWISSDFILQSAPLNIQICNLYLWIFKSAICTFTYSNLQSAPLNIQICNLHLWIFKSAICTFTYSNLQSAPLHIQICNLHLYIFKFKT